MATASTHINNSRVWLVTGCSSGLGLALIQEVLASGERVVATLRKPADIASLSDKYPSTQLLVEQLDVTDAARTKAVFEATRAHFGRLDVVVNNAGYGMQGEFETFPEEAAKAMMDVLFWGPARICREAIRFMREVNPPGQGGRILNITSMGGFVGFPTGSFYHAGKFALEGTTESFAKELLPEWNIKATIIEPGGFRTRFVEAAFVRTPAAPAYNKPHAPGVFMRKITEDPSIFVGDVAKAAKAMVRIAGLEDPPIRIQLGTDSLMAVKVKAESTIRDIERWEEISHSTNLDGVVKEKIMENFGVATK
ncbi:NAD(P)-binding protein [Polyporus arcularius HHB13444]|uniref:NAD(P)-binding protein n=1 Tax=Polyporus arcularius HHB13444 TaxID=1314778 RepID=A0A5C3P5F6_9APHY|nr:NAD(P)-binding protein [Polyporus arcularius HHB13444]